MMYVLLTENVNCVADLDICTLRTMFVEWMYNMKFVDHFNTLTKFEYILMKFFRSYEFFILIIPEFRKFVKMCSISLHLVKDWICFDDDYERCWTFSVDVQIKCVYFQLFNTWMKSYDENSMQSSLCLKISAIIHVIFNKFLSWLPIMINMMRLIRSWITCRMVDNHDGTNGDQNGPSCCCHQTLISRKLVPNSSRMVLEITEILNSWALSHHFSIRWMNLLRLTARCGLLKPNSHCTISIKRTNPHLQINSLRV
jgi:hypothetical protein